MARINAHLLPRIAIVEDDADLLRAIDFSLTAEGYPVESFESAEDLLAADNLLDVGCFVIDQRLTGLSGLELINELQRRRAPGRAVIITTQPSVELRQACWAVGVPIVEKPLLGESLNACIRGLLARRPM